MVMLLVLCLAFVQICFSIRISEVHRNNRMSWENPTIDAADFFDIDFSSEFQSWMAHYKKEYDSSEEYLHRMFIWAENWLKISKHNKQYFSGEQSFTMAINSFADLTEDEFKQAMHGKSCLLHKSKKNKFVNELFSTANKVKEDFPPAWDWTNVTGYSWVTPVKNQKQCGSCWAFSATGSIEANFVISKYYRHNLPPPKVMTQLSEQQLIDCSSDFGNKGCDGGLMDYAFEYVMNTTGLCSEEEYGYLGTDGHQCKSAMCGTKYDPISNYRDIHALSNSSSLEHAIHTYGPVSIAIQANQRGFQFYSGGVLSAKCGTRLDHGVLVVGYGQLNGRKFWKVKNSWGAKWGMNGYILLCRDCNENKGDGECGILMQPSQPIAKTQ